MKNSRTTENFCTSSIASAGVTWIHTEVSPLLNLFGVFRPRPIDQLDTDQHAAVISRPRCMQWSPSDANAMFGDWRWAVLTMFGGRLGRLSVSCLATKAPQKTKIERPVLFFLTWSEGGRVTSSFVTRAMCWSASEQDPAEDVFELRILLRGDHREHTRHQSTWRTSSLLSLLAAARVWSRRCPNMRKKKTQPALLSSLIFACHEWCEETIFLLTGKVFTINEAVSCAWMWHRQTSASGQWCQWWWDMSNAQPTLHQSAGLVQPRCTLTQSITQTI